MSKSAQDFGEAEEFEFRSAWQQRYRGEFQIVDGDLRKIRSEWVDLDDPAP